MTPNQRIFYGILIVFCHEVGFVSNNCKIVDRRGLKTKNFQLSIVIRVKSLSLKGYFSGGWLSILKW